MLCLGWYCVVRSVNDKSVIGLFGIKRGGEDPAQCHPCRRCHSNTAHLWSGLAVWRSRRRRQYKLGIRGASRDSSLTRSFITCVFTFHTKLDGTELPMSFFVSELAGLI